MYFQSPHQLCEMQELNFSLRAHFTYFRQNRYWTWCLAWFIL